MKVIEVSVEQLVEALLVAGQKDPTVLEGLIATSLTLAIYRGITIDKWIEMSRSIYEELKPVFDEQAPPTERDPDLQ